MKDLHTYLDFSFFDRCLSINMVISEITANVYLIKPIKGHNKDRNINADAILYSENGSTGIHTNWPIFSGASWTPKKNL